MTENQSQKKEESIQNIPLSERILQSWEQFCSWVWKIPQKGESIALSFIRGLLRIIFIVVRESQNDKVTLRASALTFTVVLSLVPMLALGTAVLKGLGAGDQMRQAAYSLIEQFDTESSETDIPAETAAEPDTPEIQKDENIPALPPDTSGNNQEISTTESQPAGLTSHLKRAVDQIFDYVDRTDFTTLGTFGVLGMILAALGVLGSIERSMNAIWQTATGRAFGRKIIDYMALMILLPLSVNLALGASTLVQSSALYAHIQNILPVLWVQKLLLKALPIGLLVVTFSLLYQFLPNTRVGYLPAFGGGIFGGLAWFWVQVLYVKMQIGVAKYNAIYGSFATLPLFFLWIYVAWVIFLLGAEFSFAFQTWRQYQWKSILITPSARLAMAFDIMDAALDDYGNRKITDRKSLAEVLNQTEKTVGVIVNDLVDGGLLRRVDGKLEGYVPAAPLDDLKPSEIMDIIIGKELPDVKGCDLAGRALQAARDSLDRYNIICQKAVQKNNQTHEDINSGTS
ncbi:YihY/virulence factor BrkB family protein [Thermodesulfobacteriota bacterium]